VHFGSISEQKRIKTKIHPHISPFNQNKTPASTGWKDPDNYCLVFLIIE